MEEVLQGIDKGSEDAIQASLSLFNSKVHVCIHCKLVSIVPWVFPSMVLLHVLKKDLVLTM